MENSSSVEFRLQLLGEFPHRPQFAVASAWGREGLADPTVQHRRTQTRPVGEEAALRIKASAGLRLAGSALLCVLLVAVFKTNVYATLIPLLFPRIGLAFRPAVDRKRGAGNPAAEVEEASTLK